MWPLEFHFFHLAYFPPTFIQVVPHYQYLIFVLFFILGETTFSISPVSMMLTLNLPLPSLGSFLVFTMEECCVLSNAFFFFLSFEMILCFSLIFSVYVVYDIGWLSHAEPLLHSWGKSHLVIAYNLFNTLLDLVWQYFVEDFLKICIHNACWSWLVFFFVFYWLCFCCAGVHA